MAKLTLNKKAIKEPEGEVEEEAKKKTKKKKESEGSRFAGLTLMIITVVMSIIFVLAGKWQGVNFSMDSMSEWWRNLGGGTTYVID